MSEINSFIQESEIHIPSIKWSRILKGETFIFQYFIDVEEQTICYVPRGKPEYWCIWHKLGIPKVSELTTEEELKQIVQDKWEKYFMKNQVVTFSSNLEGE